MKRILGLVLLLLAIAGMVNVVRKFAEGGATQHSGSAAYDQGQKAGKYSAPVVLVALGLFGLWLLRSDDMRPAPPSVRRSPGETLLPPGHPSLRGGQGTVASNPAQLRLSIGQWLAANLWVIAVAAGMALIGVIFLFVKLPVGIVLLLAAGIFLFREVREAQQKFYSGDVCPGVVLFAQQNLVAVYTSLTAADNVPRPAIKILKQPLHRATTEAAYDGMRVAAAALYQGDARQPAWQDFSPEVINCVVKDPEEIARVLGSISEQEWQNLDTCLAQVPVANPGLYRMWNPASKARSTTGCVPEGATDFAPGRPWFKSTPGIVGISIVGAIVGLMFLVSFMGSASRWIAHREVTNQGISAPTAPPMPGIQRPPMATAARPFQPTQAGPYTAGAGVSAQWAGRWISGKVVSINPGGFSVMVQLEDSRFPRPILLSTNQIRLR
jgi:hypothetical protein